MANKKSFIALVPGYFASNSFFLYGFIEQILTIFLNKKQKSVMNGKATSDGNGVDDRDEDTH
jgi:hypothetical protein